MSNPAFQILFGREADVSTTAPGRVNLMGDHTDYNGGYVLPTVIPLETHVELGRRSDRRIRVWSANVSGDAIEYELGDEKRRDQWVDYVQGITWALAKAGFSVRGSDLRIESQIPPGSGLGSSASLGVGLLRAMSQAFAFDIDPVRAAQLVQRSENDFVGAPVGILDPMACDLGKPGMALFIDTRSLEHNTIPIPQRVELAVIHSGISHAHAHGEYGIRRQECERAATLLGVKQLRDLQGSAEMLEQRVSALPEPYCRRARHVITENDRVLLAVTAFRGDDVSSIGALFHASHESLRDDYESSTPEIDLLVDLAGREPDILGARMTGGGFGGSVVMLARHGTAMDAGTRIASNYEKQSGRTPTLLVPEHFQHIRTTSATEVRSCQ